MQIRVLLTLSFFFIVSPLMANMAAPYDFGQPEGTTFSSEHARITSQSITATLLPDFSGALFEVEYNVYAEEAGTQIPMVFYAPYYQDQFQIWFNGGETEVRRASEHPAQIKELVGDDSADDHDDYITVWWNDEDSDMYRLDNLIFFEADFEEGEQTINVSYRAGSESGTLGWVKSYHIRYSLYPARYWNAYEGLDLTLNFADAPGVIATNLDEYSFTEDATTRTWQFDTIPDDYFVISYEPEVSAFALWLTGTGYFPLMLLWVILFAAAHLFIVSLIPNRSGFFFRFMLWGGVIAVSFFITLTPLFTHYTIDYFIGPEASGRHGMLPVFIMTLPFVVLIYGAIIWFINKKYLTPKAES